MDRFLNLKEIISLLRWKPQCTLTHNHYSLQERNLEGGIHCKSLSLSHTHQQTDRHTPWESPQLFPFLPCTAPGPSSFSSSLPASKHLTLPDLVPFGGGSGPPAAADGRFLSRIRGPGGGHSAMIYAALLYTAAASSSSSSSHPANSLLHQTRSALLFLTLFFCKGCTKHMHKPV